MHGGPLLVLRSRVVEHFVERASDPPKDDLFTLLEAFDLASREVRSIKRFCRPILLPRLSLLRRRIWRRIWRSLGDVLGHSHSER